MPAHYYQDATSTIYHGDCREIAPVLGRFDVVIADPPYSETKLAWDQWPEGWPSVMEGCSDQLWCFGSFRLFLDRQSQFSGWKLAQEIVWEKHNGSGLLADRFKRVHEFAVHWYRGRWGDLYTSPPRVPRVGPKKIIPNRKDRSSHLGRMGAGAYEDDGARIMRSVIKVNSRDGLFENETQKPEGIIRPLVEFSCPPGGLILDPCCGSGTVLRVAKDMGRRAVGIDSREEQCEVAARRLSQGALPL